MFFSSAPFLCRKITLIVMIYFSYIEASSAWLPERSPEEDWNNYLTRVSNNAGTVTIAGNLVPISVDFTIQPAVADSDLTRVKINRFYNDGSTKIARDETFVDIPHKLTETKVVPREQAYVDSAGRFYLPDSIVTRYERPSIPLIKLESLVYHRVTDKRNSKADFVYTVNLNRAPVANLPKGYYIKNKNKEVIGGELYLYSDGKTLTFGRSVKSFYDLVNVQEGYEISMVDPTEHRVTFLSGCTKTQGAFNDPFNTLPRGLYLKTAANWSKIDNSMKTEVGSEFSIVRNNAPLVNVTVDAELASKQQVLGDLIIISRNVSIGEIDLKGHSFNGNDLPTLTQLFTLTPSIESLNLRTNQKDVNYNSLVDKLISLIHLKYLDITNCGINAQNKLRMQRPTLRLIDDTPPQPTVAITQPPVAIKQPTPAVKRVVSSPAPVAPKPTVVQVIQEMGPSGQEAFIEGQWGFHHSIAWKRSVTIWSDGKKDCEPWTKICGPKVAINGYSMFMGSEVTKINQENSAVISFGKDEDKKKKKK